MRESVLVIEDDDEVRELLAIVLSEDGHHVRCAESAALALDLARRHGPVLVLLDLSLADMPLDAFVTALRNLPDFRASIIALSGAADLEAQAARIGADGFIAKPFDLEHLLGTVDDLLS